MKVKRVSKKKKISWRKHSKVKDVEKFLDEKYNDEPFGLSLTKNEDLFQIDTGTAAQRDTLSMKQKAKLKLMQPKSFSALSSSSKVLDPVKKRNRVKTKEERKSVLVRKKELRNLELEILKKKELHVAKDSKKCEVKNSNKLKKDEFIKDIWQEERTHEIESDEWANDITKRHISIGTGKVRKRVKKPESDINLAPCVELPHPGMSYNPSFKDHQNLLQEVAKKEMKIIKQNEHLNRVTKGMFSKVTEQERDSAWVEEMSQGLPSKTEKPEEDSEPSDDEYKAVNPPVVNKKKTPQQRRKQKEQMELELAGKLKKLEKKKIGDIHRLRFLDKAIKKQEEKSQILQAMRQKRKELKKKEAKRLGALKFEESDLNFNLGEEIPGNLRNLKEEGNLLVDRLKSFQKRNILQPTTRHVRKRGKVKKYTRPGYKENDWKKTIAKQF